jgi:hypothetical protein
LSGWCSHLFSSYSMCDLFFRFGGGLPLHKVPFLIFRSPFGVQTTYFAIFPLKILSNIFSILEHSCHLAPGSFIPLFLSWCIRKFFLSGLALWAARSSLVLVQSFLMTPLLSQVTHARWIVLIPAAANSLRGPPFS